MTRVAATRVQVYVNDPRVSAALKREARVAGLSLSQAAGRALARGLARRPTAEPEDRLQALERALHDHRRLAHRDMQVLQELLVDLARAAFLRPPAAAAREDATDPRSVARGIQRRVHDSSARPIADGLRRDAGDPSFEARG